MSVKLMTRFKIVVSQSSSNTKASETQADEVFSIQFSLTFHLNKMQEKR